MKEAQAATIMIVEDDQDIREVLHDFLAGEGYAVESFTNGLEAMTSLIGGANPRLILLDWRMPVMAGKQFADEFAKLTKNQTQIYIFSAENDDRLFAGVKCAGILRKPVDLHVLLTLVEKVHQWAENG